MESIIDLNAEEFNDDPTRGNPRLYREGLARDHSRTHQKGLESFRRLAGRYLNTNS
tara:strand:- start:202 stop:369 length:168 start_codon:yes stop_codon:yes gene_type:complete